MEGMTWHPCHVTTEEWQGQLSFYLTFGRTYVCPSPIPLLPRSALLCCPGKEQDLLSGVLQLVRGGNNSHELMILWELFQLPAVARS